ncbi:MAG: response regulator [Sedimentisphaerales bacterium]|jgi:two-component system sensor histidine kinase/response regulator|nr:response regulator [Sedimentisphaerales bacterium]
MLGLFKLKKTASKPKILLVDDEQDLLSTVSYRLKYAQYDVVTASNGQEALEKAAAERPDLILLDTNMPVMNGHEVLRQLRADPDLKDIPVIMLTARAAPEDVSVASSYGIADYVTKPFDFNELISKVGAAVKRDEDR